MVLLTSSLILTISLHLVCAGVKVIRATNESNVGPEGGQGLVQGNQTLDVQIQPLATARDCLEPGLQCSLQCKELIMCLQNHTGPQYLPLTILSCGTSGRYCNLENRDCSSTYCDDSAKTREAFYCRQEGTFPDPFDCRKSHVCNNNIINQPSIAAMCNPGWSFDVKLGKCMEKNDTRACKETPVSACTELGQFGVVEENSRYFYVCRRTTNGYLIPDMYACPKDTEFDKEDYICRGSASAAVLSVATLLLALLTGQVFK